MEPPIVRFPKGSFTILYFTVARRTFLPCRVTKSFKTLANRHAFRGGLKRPQSPVVFRVAHNQGNGLSPAELLTVALKNSFVLIFTSSSKLVGALNVVTVAPFVSFTLFVLQRNSVNKVHVAKSVEE